MGLTQRPSGGAFDKSVRKPGVERLDPLLLHQPLGGRLARRHGRSPAQVMLRWHLQEGRAVIPKSVRPERIAENFAVSDFELTSDDLAAIGALDTGVRSGPEPDSIDLESYGRPIPEA